MLTFNNIFMKWVLKGNKFCGLNLEFVQYEGCYTLTLIEKPGNWWNRYSAEEVKRDIRLLANYCFVRTHNQVLPHIYQNYTRYILNQPDLPTTYSQIYSHNTVRFPVFVSVNAGVSLATRTPYWYASFNNKSITTSYKNLPIDFSQLVDEYIDNFFARFHLK